jgi:7-carboxy-7-deazaguanine synthase
MTTDTAEGRLSLRVAEQFGPTFQGEGPTIGQRALFVRLSGCNLDCSWCDTPYTWDWSRFDRAQESRDIPVTEVVDWVLAHDADLVIITGGEPLIQQRRLLPLAADLTNAGRRIEIETNGTIPPHPSLVELVSRLNVSPKLAGSGVPIEHRIRPMALRAFRDCGKAVFKFVIANDGDVVELIELQTRYELDPVWVMPQGTTERSVLHGLRTLGDLALVHGWNLTARLHVLMWGDQRGR